MDKAKDLNTQLLYLPTYSPNLNLIERLWKFLKKKFLEINIIRNLMNSCLQLRIFFKNIEAEVLTVL